MWVKGGGREVPGGNGVKVVASAAGSGVSQVPIVHAISASEMPQRRKPACRRCRAGKSRLHACSAPRRTQVKRYANPAGRCCVVELPQRENPHKPANKAIARQAVEKSARCFR